MKKLVQSTKFPGPSRVRFQYLPSPGMYPQYWKKLEIHLTHFFQKIPGKNWEGGWIIFSSLFLFWGGDTFSSYWIVTMITDPSQNCHKVVT